MYPLGKTCGYSFAEGKLLEVNGIVLLVIKNDHEFEHKLYSWGVRRVRAGMQLGSRNCPGRQGTPAHPSASFYKELRKNSAACKGELMMRRAAQAFLLCTARAASGSRRFVFAVLAYP